MATKTTDIVSYATDTLYCSWACLDAAEGPSAQGRNITQAEYDASFDGQGNSYGAICKNDACENAYEAY